MNTHDIRLYAAVAQARLKENDVQGAITALEGIDVTEAPGLVGAKCALLETSGNIRDALKNLNQLDSVYAQNDHNNRQSLAAHFLALGESQTALEVLPTYKHDNNLLAKAICATYHNIDQARSYVSSLTGDDYNNILENFDHPQQVLDDQALEQILSKSLPPRDIHGKRGLSIDTPRQEKKSTLPLPSFVDHVTSEENNIIDINRQKSQAAILRRRAKKRQAYLAKLSQQGKYDPKKPTQPDPERWLPKKLRASNKHRAKSGRNKIQAQSKMSGAQGVEINAKELAKLDVAARTAAAEQQATLQSPNAGRANTVAGGSRKSNRRRGGKK
mmetsp:Transcript_939/g.1164  ORF Transcript_939/g.1164 Transcript_939/m.1164 type:complete len:329 (+) Transcript_939:98-1084(+)